MNKIVELSKNPDSNEFLKCVYDYYVENNYDIKEVNKILEFNGFERKEIKNILLKYIKENLNMDEDTFKEYRLKEREKNKDIYIGYKNRILEKAGINTKFLYRTDKEKEIFLKGLYEEIEKNNCSIEFIKEISDEFHIRNIKCIEYYKEYVLNYLNISEDDLTENQRYLVFATQADLFRIGDINTRNVIRKIIESNSLDEIDTAVNESGLEKNYILSKFRIYKKFYKVEDQKNFYKKYELYLKDQKVKRYDTIKENFVKDKYNNELKTAEKIITSFLDNKTLSFDEFLEVKNITKETFNNYLNALKMYNKELYNRYNDSISKKEQESEDNISLEIKLLEEGILNGYEENGLKREFDIIDYLTITKIPTTKIGKFDLSKINSKARMELHRIKNNFKYINKEDKRELKNILETTKIVGVKFDKNGSTIPGSGRTITDEEKNNLIDYLREREIPVNNGTYNALLKRYLNGFIDFTDKKKKILNNQ